MSRSYFIFVAAIVSFCSMSYELALAQLLTTVFGNTVFQYSMTIGIFLSFLGIGALCAHLFVKRDYNYLFLRLEIFISVIALVSPFLILVADKVSIVLSSWIPFLDGVLYLLTYLFSWIVIAVIGFLTGIEIPVVIEMAKEASKDQQRDPTMVILGVDYIGSFLATIAFPLILYPTLGLPGSIAVFVTLNLGIAIMTMTQDSSRPTKQNKLTGALGLGASVGLIFLSQKVSLLLTEIFY